MRRIIISLLIMVGAVTAIAFGSTGAFFSDSEISTGNTFAAGAIDLKIDNHRLPEDLRKSKLSLNLLQNI